MTDSLSRLILRAQGRLPIVEPLLRSRYADAVPETAWTEEYLETAALTPSPTAIVVPATRVHIPTPRPNVEYATARDTAARPLTRDIPPTVDTPTATQGQRHEAVPLSFPQELPQADTAPAFAPALTEALGQPGPPQPPSRHQAPPTEPMRSGTVLQEVTIPASPRPTVAAALQLIGEQRRSIPVMERPAAAVRTLNSLQTRPEHPAPVVVPTIPTRPAPGRADDTPNVHISIGRIEVHATPPLSVPAAPSRPVPARRPTMSLSDYLADRGRAR